MGSGAGKQVIISEVRKEVNDTNLPRARMGAASTLGGSPSDAASPKDWSKIFDMEGSPTRGANGKEPGPQPFALEQIAELASFQECALTKTFEAQPDETSQREFTKEEAVAAMKLVRCLEIRQRYVGSFEHLHTEAQTVKFTDKGSDKILCAKVLAQFDGDSTLALLEGGRRMEWDPFSGTPPGAKSNLSMTCEDGVFVIRNKEADNARIDEGHCLDVEDFCKDYVTVLRTMRDRGVVSFAEPRLRELDLKFQLHTHRNANKESRAQRDIAGRDWYQVRKVDTHIHHSACFTQRQLMKFIRHKMRDEMDTQVMEENGKVLTLREVFSTAGVSDVEDVNADRLCTMASVGNGAADTFGRFDVFNSKYNPFGDKRLRDIFLKSDNYIGGRFLAELTKEVMEAYHKQKFVHAEWRISIYGKSKDEWAKLAKWFRTYNIQCEQIRWVIQVPRLYTLFRNMGIISNFADMLRNIFEPIFEASMDPQAHEDMFFMLQQVVGFDSVDDESQGTHQTLSQYPPPEEWTSETNPPYTYWMYHMYANIRSLNVLRREMGLNTLKFRPHCGEAGNVSHLCSGFMLADAVCHGVQLKESPVLQYLCYLSQIGLAVSPLSNDILFIPLDESPFGLFFRRGLNVSLSTDDPLIIHLTEDPLMEEYVVAARTFRLSNCDMCEIARNSVLQSGFENAFKEWWIGTSSHHFDEHDEKKSNVPKMRVLFRKTCLQQEYAMLAGAVQAGTQG